MPQYWRPQTGATDSQHAHRWNDTLRKAFGSTVFEIGRAR
jgi:hypothetical protein